MDPSDKLLLLIRERTPSLSEAAPVRRQDYKTLDLKSEHDLEDLITELETRGLIRKPGHQVTAGNRVLTWGCTLTYDGRKSASKLQADSAESRAEPAPELANKIREPSGKRVFIGHGRSDLWRELKEYLSGLGIDCAEFNAEPTGGVQTTERLETMLSQAGMAFLIMTPEDKHADGTMHARPNVIHEIGLFQGRLGTKRAIIMIEEGCAEFSNVAGVTSIPFRTGSISASFHLVHGVLKREGFC
jgi:hypothetical protein